MQGLLAIVQNSAAINNHAANASANENSTAIATTDDDEEDEPLTGRKQSASGMLVELGLESSQI